MAHKSLPRSIYSYPYSPVGAEPPIVPVEGVDVATHAGTSGVNDSLGKNGEIKVSTGTSGTTISIGNGATQLIIAQSGQMTLKSSSSAGIVLSATNGTVTIDAPSVSLVSAGELKLGGKSVSIASAGGGISLQSDGGPISIGGASMSQEINGAYIIKSGDFGLLASGNMRQTIAGSTRIQSSGLMEIDTGGYMKVRTTGALDLNCTGSINLYSAIGVGLHSQEGGIYISAKNLVQINSADSDIRLSAQENLAINSATGNMFIQAKNNILIDSTGKLQIRSIDLMGIHSKNKMVLRSSANMELHSRSDVEVASESSVNISGDVATRIFGGTHVDLDSNADIHMQMGHATQIDAEIPETASPPVGPGPVQGPEAPHVETAENIINETGSKLSKPEIPTHNLGAPGGGGSGGGGGNINGGGGGGNSRVTGSSVGRTTNRGVTSYPSLEPARAGDVSTEGVDSRLMDIMNCARQKYEQATGAKVVWTSARADRQSQTSGYHPGGKAIDIQIHDPCNPGKGIGNYQVKNDDFAFAAYEVFAHQAKQCHEQGPHRNVPFRWGGYFTGKDDRAYGYGAMDTMHFDIGSNSTAAGSWAGGLSSEFQGYYGLTPGATSGYTGAPDYNRVNSRFKNCSNKEPTSGDDRWAKEKTVAKNTSDGDKHYGPPGKGK